MEFYLPCMIATEEGWLRKGGVTFFTLFDKDIIYLLFKDII